MMRSLRAPLGMLGVVYGLAAASIFLPDGCGINAVQSLRLRVGMPILTPLILIALAGFTARARVRRAAALGIGGALAIALAAALLYAGPGGIAVVHLGLVILHPLVLGVAVGAPLLRAAAPRHPGAMWALASAVAATATFAEWAYVQHPIDRGLGWAAWAADCALLGVALLRVGQASGRARKATLIALAVAVLASGAAAHHLATLPPGSPPAAPSRLGC
jgi:hypothetical protein